MGQAKKRAAELATWLETLSTDERKVFAVARAAYEKIVKAQNATGMCYRMTFFMTAYLTKELSTQVEPVVGYINDGSDDLMISHAWVEIGGKKTDINLTMTEHPQAQLTGPLLILDREFTHRFVMNNKGENGEFKTEVAKLGLADLWKLEKALLKSIGNYPKLRSERALGDMRMTEWASVTYDNLGHLALCLLHPFPEWTSYALSECRPLIETLASMNSWKAKELLGYEQLSDLPPPSDADLAARFFFGDIGTLQELRHGYSSPK
jgi:hypothetical protein